MGIKIEFESGDFDILFSPPMAVSRRLAALLADFQSAIDSQGVSVWPPDSADLVCFTKFRLHYYKLAAHWNFDPANLTPESRHRFFVCTAPFEYENNAYREVCDLERLLGFRSFEEALKDDDREEDPDSTGDPFLDVTTMALLTFKVSGLEDRYGLDDLAKMCKRANDVLRRVEREAKGEVEAGDETLEKEPFDSDFETDKRRISAGLKALGVELPLGM